MVARTLERPLGLGRAKQQLRLSDCVREVIRQLERADFAVVYLQPFVTKYYVRLAVLDI